MLDTRSWLDDSVKLWITFTDSIWGVNFSLWPSTCKTSCMPISRSRTLCFVLIHKCWHANMLNCVHSWATGYFLDGHRFATRLAVTGDKGRELYDVQWKVGNDRPWNRLITMTDTRQANQNRLGRWICITCCKYGFVGVFFKLQKTDAVSASTIWSKPKLHTYCEIKSDCLRENKSTVWFMGRWKLVSFCYLFLVCYWELFLWLRWWVIHNTSMAVWKRDI